MLVQLAQVHNDTITDTVQQVCDLILDHKFKNACREAVKFIENVLIEM